MIEMETRVKVTLAFLSPTAAGVASIINFDIRIHKPPPSEFEAAGLRTFSRTNPLCLLTRIHGPLAANTILEYLSYTIHYQRSAFFDSQTRT
jgi:hypothetical protein